MTAKNGKPCKKCGTSEWYADGKCKKCRLERGHRWREANRGKLAEHYRLWRQANHEKERERIRRWKQANLDKIAEQRRRLWQANSEREIERNRRWQKANPDKVAAIGHRRRTRQTNAGGSYTAAEFKALCKHYGNKCLRCNRTDVKLTFDHILPVSKGGSSDISNGQPLCGRCNTAKKDKYIDYRPDAGPLRWLQAKLFG